MKTVSRRKIRKWEKWVLAIVLLFIIALILILLLSKDEKAGSKAYKEKDATETTFSEEQFSETEYGSTEGVSIGEKDKLYNSEERPNAVTEKPKENSGTIIDKIKVFFAPKGNDGKEVLVKGEEQITDKKEENADEDKLLEDNAQASDKKEENTDEDKLVEDNDSASDKKEENADEDKLLEDDAQASNKKEENSSENVNEPSEKNEGEERGQLEIKEKMDASYEKYLAAGVVAAISMQHPDFEIKEICLTGEHSIENRISSEGVYVRFEAGGKQMAVHSRALENERQEKGTIDLYTMDLGFSTFDTIDVELAENVEGENVDVNELDKLIAQSLLISLYEH